jgi:hypothetical protein
MTMLVTAALFSLLLTALALRANTHLRAQPWLPMQWGFGGQVTWSAPRHIALAFVPAMSVVVFAILLIPTLTKLLRPDRPAIDLPGLVAIGLLFFAIQQFHLWMIGRTLRGNGG